MNPSATLENTNIQQLIEKWVADWQVPPHHYWFWRDTLIRVVEDLHVSYASQWLKVPAATYAEEKRIDLDPQWANPGVLAHEMAHIAFYLLHDTEKADFSTDYHALMTATPLLRLLWSEKQYVREEYGKNGDREGHAEVYRYLGEKMPQSLKGFYPNMV